MSTAQGIVIFDDSTRHRPPVTVDAPANTTTTNTATNTTTINNNKNNSGKILQKRWVCDVCKVKWFLDFKEACAHEAVCTGASSSNSSSTSSSSSSVADLSSETTNVVSESSLISADSNDGINGATKSSTGNNKSTPSAAAIAAARARPSEEKNANEISDDAAHNGRKKPKDDGANNRGADIVMDSSDGEEDCVDADNIIVVSSSDSGSGSVHSSFHSSFHSSSGSKRKSDAIIIDESTKHASESTQVAMLPGRRKSKRLRDAPSLKSKPPPLQDSNTTSHNANIGASNNKANNGKKGNKKSKSIKPSSKPTKKKGTENANSSGGSLASIFLLKKAPKAPKRESKKATKKAHASSVAETLLPGGVSRKEYEEHLVAEKLASKRKNKRTAAVEKKKRTSSRSKRSRSAEKSEDEDAVDATGSSSEEDDSNDSDDGEFADGASARAASKEKKRAENFLSKKQMAEHRAADFFAKRKKAAAEERERQKKREELRRLTRSNDRKDGEGVVDDVKLIKPLSCASVQPVDGHVVSSGVSGGGRKEKCVPAVRFPRPSHVVPEDDNDVESQSTDGVSLSLQALRKTPRFPHLKVDITPVTDVDEVTAPSSRFIRDGDPLASVEKNTAFDLLSSVFNQNGKGDKNKKKDKDKSSADDNQLWVDKYSMSSIPHDVLGRENKDASQKLLDFVQDWKVRRHKSVQTLGRAKRKNKRRKKRSSGYDSDDSFLDSGGLENIFLVTGPTGAGKTSLVHAVAQQLECVVIELNSAEPRSGVALKRAIQETTQSHSSLAISKKKKKDKRGGKEKGGHLFRSAAEDLEDNVRDDAEDGGEGDSDESCCFDSESDEESVRESHSLTVILIDEVDLLFDEDTSFWPALAQVSLKAKCPIVLTASSVPPQLVKNFKFQSISLDRPPPQECSIKMADVSQSEGMRPQNDVSSEERLKRLSLMAEICRCDIRKILNEMQLFHFSESRRSMGSCGEIDLENNRLQLGNVDCPSAPLNVEVAMEDKPLVLGVEPKLLPRDRHTLITITGKNFSSTTFPIQSSMDKPTTLFIGAEQCSHFRVVSDDKIVAVCPPCVLPKGVSQDAIYDGNFLSQKIDCLTGKFPEVMIRKKCSNGLILDSSSCLGLKNNNESTSWCIEYDIPLRDSVFEQKKLSRDEFIRKAKERQARENTANDDEDGGFLSSSDEELTKTKLAAQSPILDEVDQSQHENNDDDAIDNAERADVDTMEGSSQEKEPETKVIDPQAMLDEATIGLKTSEGTPTIKASMSAEHSVMSSLEINRFANELERLSDAVLLEDSFTTLGIPALSGAVEGFGSHAVESFSTVDPSVDKLCKGKNKKPPSLDSLYSTGANDSGFFFGSIDSYVTHPQRQRDRQLLSYSDRHSRGLGFLDNYNCLSEDDPDDSKSELDEEDETDLSFFVQLRTRVRSEDDVFINPCTSAAVLLLPSLLEQGHGVSWKSSFTKDRAPLLQSRRNRRATNALGTMHTVLANCDIWHNGLRHDDDYEAVRKNVWLGGSSVLDHPLSIDYLPFLRAIASHENRTRHQLEDLMKEKSEDVTRGRRRTRASSRNDVRRHYLDELAFGQDKMIEVKSLELAKNYMA